MVLPHLPVFNYYIMAQGKKSFIIYCDLIHEVDHLTDEEKGKLFQHLLEYVNDMNPVMDDRVLLGSWKHIQRQLKRDLLKYEDIKEKRSEAGKASAEKRKQVATNPTSVKSAEQTPTNPTVNDTDTDTDTDNDTGNEIKETDFDIFWKEFNYNVGQRQTQDEWSIITKDMPNEIAKILIHVPKYVLSKPDKKYRKKPENYLKERIWQDEIEALNTKEELNKEAFIPYKPQPPRH